MITSDAIGNPLKWRDSATMTWFGRQLKTYAKGGTTTTYLYDDSGLRTRKTVGSTTTDYLYLGGNLVYQKSGTTEIYFYYDAQGVAGFTYTNGSTVETYYYMKNLQGDIINILDKDGKVVVTYTYDAWGNIISTTGTLASTVGAINPLR